LGIDLDESGKFESDFDLEIKSFLNMSKRNSKNFKIEPTPIKPSVQHNSSMLKLDEILR